jgi:hypothetical protein
MFDKLKFSKSNWLQSDVLKSKKGLGVKDTFKNIDLMGKLKTVKGKLSCC